MDNFLQKVSEIIYNKYSSDFSEICIVFPNKRAGLYFSDYISKLNNKTIWLPKVLSIIELFEQTTQLQVADDLTLNFILYQEYNKKTKVKENFDQFYVWGSMLLNDFNEIDKYLVNAKDLFTNIASLKDIENQFDYLTPEQIEIIKSFWKNFETASKQKTDFLSIWTLLNDIYVSYNAKLKSEGIAYEGMLYREVINNINANKPIETPFKKIIFIGFNALTKCEEIYFSYLKNIDKAEFYWDYDNYYYDDNKHEAGYFIRKYNKMFPSVLEKEEFDNFNGIEKDIDIIAVPSNVGQAKILNNVLTDLKTKAPLDYSKTVIIFTDESVLLPSLYSLPDDIKEINITMGFPLKNTPIYGLIESLINLQLNIKSKTDGTYKYYYKDVLAILNHQYIKFQHYDEIQKIISNLTQHNILYVNPDEVNKIELLNKLFVKLESADKVSEYLINILEDLYYKFKNSTTTEEKKQSFETEYIYHTYLLVKKLKEIVTIQNIALTFQSYYNLLKQLLQTKKLPFVGEPLKGLQLMGILETRCLDFENVIILSVNEGVFPVINSSHSFVPYSLRKGFELPTIENQNSIYSYYFYRVIQRAKNISLIYNSDTNNSDTGEMSRFLYQLKYESGKKITEKNLGFDISNTTIKEIKINKDKSVIDLLNNYTSNSNKQSYLSPSAIITYLDCKLKFYFNNVIKLRETDEFAEDIDPAVFGNILHDSLSTLYNPFIRKEISKDALDEILNNKELIGSSIKTAFQSQYSKDIEITGRNILIYEILKKYIYQIIEIDKKISPFTVLALEKQFVREIPLNINNTNFNVRIGGKIDRLDMLNDKSVRVVDYKTGTIKNSISEMEKLFSREDEKRINAVFQTFFYSYILPDSEKSKYKITPSVYWIRDSYNTNFNYNIIFNKETVIDFKNLSDDFEEQFKVVIEEIFNAEIPFEQCNNDKICSNCSYKEICNR